MDKPNFDDTLLRVLEKEVEREKWRKKLKIKGIVAEKRTTKKGSFMLKVETKKSEYVAIIPKFKTNLFEIAKGINIGDFVKIIGDKNIDVVFCDSIDILEKNIENGKQMKLRV